MTEGQRVKLRDRPHIVGTVTEVVNEFIVVVDWDTLTDPSRCHVTFLVDADQ